jgi:hypothetical protein
MVRLPTLDSRATPAGPSAHHSVLAPCLMSFNVRRGTPVLRASAAAPTVATNSATPVREYSRVAISVMPDDITRQPFLDVSGLLPDVDVFDHVDVFMREQPVSSDG